MTAKIRELARQIEAAIPSGEEMKKMRQKAWDSWIDDKRYGSPSYTERFQDLLAQRFQIIGQAAGGIIASCEIEEAKVKAQLEQINSVCPNCKSTNLKRGRKNMFCDDCGFFPIPIAEKEEVQNG